MIRTSKERGVGRVFLSSDGKWDNCNTLNHGNEIHGRRTLAHASNAPSNYPVINEHPNGSIPEQPPQRQFEAISDLLRRADPDKIRMAVCAIQKASTGKLNDQLRDRSTTRLALFLVHHELSKRGIPPVLREHSGADSIEELCDLLTVDLDWIVTRYPDQKIDFKGWQNLFSTAQFAAKAKFIFHSGIRPEWKIRKALAITREQETELCHLQSAQIDKRRSAIKESKSEISEVVRQKRYDRNLTIVTPKEQEEVKRMIDYWEAANLCDGWGQPTRAAWFYEVMTGSKSTRQQAGNIMGKLERDLGRKARIK